MEYNILLIIFILLMISCIIRGATKGMLRIVFGMVAWIFLIIFVNYAGEFTTGYITSSTAIPSTIQETIDEHLHQKYTESEEKEAGTGQDAVMHMVPKNIQEKITESVQSSIDATIKLIAEELSLAAIKGISTIVCVIAGVLIIFLLSKLVRLIGLVPGVKDINRILGVAAGFAEGMLITWLMMFIADCFPASAMGQFIITNAEADQMLFFIYQNNIIERIIGI